MRPETPQAKEPPAPAYAADPAGAIPPLSAREKWAQEVIERWKQKQFALKPGKGPAGESEEEKFDREIRETTLVMTDAEAKEYNEAWSVEIDRRVRRTKLGLTKHIPGDVFMKEIKERIKRNERLLAESGDSG